uniref:Transcription factor CBF/NF-Y/archaeal histone domain-containing protein n=1 Tax=Lotharella globosa TaxID=91324 RepID=A0A7S4DXN3_9EUKA
MAGVAVRYSADEIEKIQTAAKEFTKEDGSISWEELFKKHSFPNRTPANVKAKYKSLLRRRKRHMKASQQQLAKRQRIDPASTVSTYDKVKSGLRGKSRKKKREQELKRFDDPSQGGKGLQIGRVKKVIQHIADGDSWRFEKEAVPVIAKATEMFILWFAEKTSEVSGNRKISIDDMVTASKLQVVVVMAFRALLSFSADGVRCFLLVLFRAFSPRCLCDVCAQRSGRTSLICNGFCPNIACLPLPTQEESRFLRVALFNNYVPEGM